MRKEIKTEHRVNDELIVDLIEKRNYIAKSKETLVEIDEFISINQPNDKSVIKYGVTLKKEEAVKVAKLILKHYGI